VYSAIPVVAAERLAIDPFVAGVRASHSIGFATGTGDCGSDALNVFDEFPRVGFA
jgi:hypothetical protein